MEKPKARVGIGIFVFKDNKFIMIKRKGSHGDGTWSVPGGHLEFGEQFEDTAIREVMEETGLEIKNVRFGAVTNDIFEKENKHYVTIWMVSEYKSGVAKILEPDKCSQQDWFTFDTLPKPLFLPWEQLLKSHFIEYIKKELS
jgi:8-oxo-dGTP diphosphatase